MYNIIDWTFYIYITKPAYIIYLYKLFKILKRLPQDFSDNIVDDNYWRNWNEKL